jgi:hypothetical protein
MQYANLDIIIRRTLLERGLPIHWYPELLFHQASAIRELSKDTITPINTVRLLVNSYGAVDLPTDFVDDIAVSISVGQFLAQLPKNDAISPLRLHNATTGAFEPYTNIPEGESQTFWDVPNGYGAWFWNVNDWGEPTGRNFGAHGGTSAGYQVFRERGQIQLTESFISDNDDSFIVLKYISNGQSADSATQVDWRAHKCIQAYSDWQRSPNAALKDSPEASTYYNEKRLLRANVNDMTVVDIKNILRNSYKATIKG